MSASIRYPKGLRVSGGISAFVLAVVILNVSTGCGGGSNGGGSTPPVTPTITSVAVSCSPALILTNQTTTCTPTVSGTGSYSSGVTWTVSPATIGSVSSAGVFTPTGTGTATVTATSTQDATKSGSATVTITVPPTITSVSVACSPASILTTQTSTCTSTVAGTGSFSAAVTWSVSPASIGAVSSAGVFTPATAGTATISATSTQDTTKFGSATVVVTVPPAITSVSVACTPASILMSQTSTCSATVQGTGAYGSTVTWAATDGSITSSGVFTPTASGTATITATSTQDTTKSGSAAVAVATSTALVITISDLPTGTPGNVTLTDPNGQQSKLTSTLIVNAIPGTYTVAAAPVVVGTSTYNAIAATQAPIVTAGNATNVKVDYKDVVPATTKVLDSVALSNLSVSTDGLIFTMSASSPVAQSLAVGNVIVVPPTSSSGVAPMGMLRKVVAIGTSNSDIVATTQVATLSDAFQRLDFQVQSQLNSTTIQAVHSARGVSFRPGESLHSPLNSIRAEGSPPPTDPCGGYSLGVFDVSKDFQVDAVPGLTLSGSVEVCSGLNFGVDIVGTGFLGLIPAVNSLSASASMGEYSDLTLQGDLLTGSFDPDPTVLGTLDFPPIEVPGVPVWVSPKVSVFIGANGDVTSDVSAEVSSAGTFTGGVTYASGAWTPVPLTPSFQFAYQPPTLNASLSAKAYAGVEFDLYILDLVGPSFKPDAYLDLEADISKNPWWTLTGGLEGPMSLDVDFLGIASLPPYDLGTLFDYSYPIVTASGPFPPPTNNPVPSIGTLTPASLAVGATPQTLNILGTGFLASSTVTFNGVIHAATYTDETLGVGQLTISLTSADLATAGTYPVVVTNPAPGGGSSAAVNFIVDAINPIPTIAALSPVSLVVNSTPQTLTINGTGFLASSTVTFDGTAHAADFVSADELTIFLTAPDLATAGTYPVVVINPAPGGGSSAAAGFSVATSSTSNEWTWMGGSDTANATGVYGMLGSQAAGNVPGGRDQGVSWTYGKSGFWLFGGAPNTGIFGDLWRFDPNASLWTWVSGSSTVNSPAIYGTLGVPAKTNTPGSRIDSMTWTDKSGNLWLFGGLYDSYLNDLWEFNPSTSAWTWISGADTLFTQSGVYGTQGVPAGTNVPGGRCCAATWFDTSGNLWLFGGQGFDDSGTQGTLNDLWEFSPTAKTWTWISGYNHTLSGSGYPGVYGTKGVPSTSNFPATRDFPVSWIDVNGNLWLFGGRGIDSTGTSGLLNDLWEFSPTNRTWTWVSGSNLANASGVYGTEGIPATTNSPGSRYGAASWVDGNGYFWLFAGEDNQLWKFSPTAKTWTWQSGSMTGQESGIYGVLGTPNSANIPGTRFAPVSWLDSNGNLWLFGGVGADSTGAGGQLNDLWRYQP